MAGGTNLVHADAVGCHRLRQRLLLHLGVAVSVLMVFHPGRPARLAAETSPVIEPHVRTAVTAGRARVLIDLRIAGGTRPEGERDAIAAAQDGVVSRLTGTDFSVSRRYTSVPQLALEIGADALAALERMGDLVARVHADRAVPPTR
jgi:hypothetical protein